MPTAPHILVCWLTALVPALDPGKVSGAGQMQREGQKSEEDPEQGVTAEAQWPLALSPSSSESEADTQGQRESHCS